MADGTAETSGRAGVPQPLLRVVGDPRPRRDGGRRAARDARSRRESPPADELLAALHAAEERAEAIADRVERRPRSSSQGVRVELERSGAASHALPRRRARSSAPVSARSLVAAVRPGAVGACGGLRAARDLGHADVHRARHATWRSAVRLAEPVPRRRRRDPARDAVHAGARLPLAPWASTPTRPIALGRFLALVGIVVFAFALGCVFLYVRRLAGSTAAWVSIPVLLGVFGPPHVIWASDLSLHGGAVRGLLPADARDRHDCSSTLLVLERRSRRVARRCMRAGSR